MPGAKRKRLDICSECKHATKPAINAAKLGHAQCLTTAYRDLGAFNERDDFGATPIHFAARFGKLECLTWLVTRSGVSPNAVSRNGSTAAHDAAAMGHLDCLQYLLKNTKCSRQDTTSEGATVLHMACRFGRLDVVKWLMEFSNSSPSEKGANNVTPVHLCAAKNNLSCLQYLTQHPQYVPNEQTAHGATPVYFAAQEGCLETLQWLSVHGGGDLYCTATDGMAPIHAAAQAGQTSCLQWLVEEGGVPIRYKAEDGATPAHFAAASGRVDCLDWIIDHGGSIYDRDNLGGTPVHDAAEQGQLSALRYLMNREVDMATEDYEGMKPLDLARDNNHDECVKLLFKTVKPSILLSLTPHQSLSRGASKAEEDEALEKQRKFEEAMLSGVSAERREAIWQSAQQKATAVQSGLKQILDGEAVASPSSLSLEGQLVNTIQAGGSSMQITPVGSLRHSRHSIGRSPKSLVTNEFEPDDIQSYKPRPPLSPTLFQMPSQDEEEPSEAKKSKTAAISGDLPESPTDKQSVTMLQPPLSPLRKIGLDKSSNSPIPERAKFIKKLKESAKHEHTPRVASPTRKENRPLSPGPKAATSPQKTKQLSSPQKIPLEGKRAKSPPSRKQAPDSKKSTTSTGKRPTLPAPKKPTGKRPTSPAPKKPTTAPGKRPTSPAPKKPTTAPGKRPTSPAPKKPTTAPDKRPTSPAPKKPTGKRPTSPAPKKPTTASGKRPTSPAPTTAPGKRPISPAPKKPTTARGKRPTSPAPKKPIGKRPTSPAPNKTDQKPKEAASGAKKPERRPTSPPPKQPVSGLKKVTSLQKPPEQLKKKQADGKRSSLPPKALSGKESAPKRPISTAVSPKDANKSLPSDAKRKLTPPRSLSPTGNQKKTSAALKAPSPPPERGRPRTKEQTQQKQGIDKRVVSPAGKRPTQSPVKKTVTKAEKGASVPAPKRPVSSKQGAVKGSKQKPLSKKKLNQRQKKSRQSAPTRGEPKQEPKDTVVTMSSALDNFPTLDTDAPPVEDDNITKQANKTIEQLLNKSLLQPDTIPVSAATEEIERESPPEEPQPESSKEEPEKMKEEEAYEQFASNMASCILEESLVEQGEEDPRSSLPAPIAEVSPADADMNEVVLRNKTGEKSLQPRISSYKEGIVISKPPERKSLKTKDETVTVTFVTKSSNIKRPFPVTHHQLLTEDDLESPGASDEEGAQRESFTTPGFDRLDMNTFEEFGTDLKKRRTVEEESFSRESEKMGNTVEQEDIRQTLDLEDVGTDDKEEEAIDDEKRRRSASDGDKLETEDKDVALEDEIPQDGGLTRWSNRQSLDKINQTPAPIKEPVSTNDEKQYTSPSEIYQKLQNFDLQKKERGYTDVLRMVDRFQGNRQSQTGPLDEPEESDKSESVGISDRLKMFGGGASFIKPPAPKGPAKKLNIPSTFAQKTELDMQGSKARSRSESSSPATSREASPGRSRNLTRRSSSCLSVTAFETIAEEDTSGAESDASKVEDTDKFTPLPKIHPGLHRRQSEERLRLDGLAVQEEVSLSASKSDTALIPGAVQVSKSGNKTHSPPEMGQRRHSGSAVYSPLVKSSSPMARKKEEKAKMGRPLSMPASPPKGSEALALFMNSANLPHLNHLKEKHERDQTKLAEERVTLLLSKPRCTGEAVPLEFQGLEFKEKDKLYVWKQKAGSLHRLGSLDSVNFEPKATFIFLHIASRGPLLYHVYLWVGGNVSDFALQSVYQHCQRLVACSPGRPVLHREFQGHESVSFTYIMKKAGKKLSDYRKPFLNISLKESKLYTFKNSDSTFTEVQDPGLGGDSLAKLSVPVILDTPISVFLWLPRSYWDEERGEQKQSAFDISELFVVQNRYPRWTPVTIVTDQVEAEQFFAHFSSWPWVDLRVDERSKELRLPFVQAPAVSYPVTGQTKVWQLVDHELVVIPIDQFGHFDSSSLFVVQYAYLKQSALYTWMEGTVYVWVGEGVGGGGERDVLVREALDKVETIGPTKLPIVIVPEGHEPIQLLNLYKGKFIIHKHVNTRTITESGCRLYKVSGTGILSMKAVEVIPKASSLHSGHAYILLGPHGEYVWSGQFSNQAQRRGALLVAKALNKSKDLIKLAEGLEIQEFWDDLGGKTKHSHFCQPVSPSYILSHLFLCEVDKGTVLFQEMPPTSKKDMKSSQCYFFVYKEQILVWQGNNWRKDKPPTSLAQTYISRYHSRRMEREFVVTLVTEGKEGEMFWKWFDMQNPSVTMPTSDPKPATEPEKDDDLTIEDIEEIESLVTDTPPLSEKPPQDIQLEAIKDTTNPDSQVQDPNIAIRDPSATHSISLTQSQEVAFEKVEKLKAELDDLVERESEGSGEDQPDGTTAGGKGDEIQTSPVRTSETMKQMSDMINGLDNILQSNSGAGVQEATPLESGASAVSLQSPSVGNLMETSEDFNLSTPPAKTKKAKKQPASPAPKPPPSLLVTVEIDGTNRSVEVRVREKAPVITVMFRAAQQAGCTLSTKSALFEVLESLKLYRALEDHELIQDVMSLWPKKDKPKLLLRDFATKNVLWSDNPPIPKGAINAYIKSNTVPNISAQLQHCSKGVAKLPWREDNFSLRPVGMYSLTETKKKGPEVNLSTSLDHVQYIPMIVKGKFHTTPTPFCFVMKAPTSWREKDLTFYCASSLPTMSKWIHAIRLFKHGIQLKANYIAMKTRVQKQVKDEKKDTSHEH